MNHSLSRDPPDILYHYTSQSGFLGIMKSKNIWATNLRYLNDDKEFIYSIELFGKVLKEATKSIPEKKNDFDPNQEIKFFEDIVSLFESSIPDPQIYVSSFSANGDSLSQWRGYCNEGNGFSIGFDTENLKKQMNKHDILLKPCIYKEAEQEKLIKDKFTDVRKKYKSKFDEAIRHFEKGGSGNDPEISKSVNELRMEFAQTLLEIGPLIKHLSFCEEEEWRLVKRVKPGPKNLDIKYRQGKSMIIPFVKLKLAEKDELLPIKNVIIGPTPHEELSKSSVDSILSSNGLQTCHPVLSRVPFRDW